MEKTVIKMCKHIRLATAWILFLSFPQGRHISYQNDQREESFAVFLTPANFSQIFCRRLSKASKSLLRRRCSWAIWGLYPQRHVEPSAHHFTAKCFQHGHKPQAAVLQKNLADQLTTCSGFQAAISLPHNGKDNTRKAQTPGCTASVGGDPWKKHSILPMSYYGSAIRNCISI